ncbi:EAL domain-containing protein [Vibrio rotiferianus]|uniref:EAL domain-containing protein n=1 Tax=Vibrio rotiferianus TaxID=190895 RepID=UPI00406AA821
MSINTSKYGVFSYVILSLSIMSMIFVSYGLSSLFVLEQDNFQLISIVGATALVSFLRYRAKAIPSVVLGLFFYYWLTGRGVQFSATYSLLLPIVPFLTAWLFHTYNDRARHKPASIRLSVFFLTAGCFYPLANTLMMLIVSGVIGSNYFDTHFLVYATLGGYLTQLLVTPTLYVATCLLTGTDHQRFIALNKSLRHSTNTDKRYLCWLFGSATLLVLAVYAPSSFLLNTVSFGLLLVVISGLSRHGIIQPLVIGSFATLLIMHDAINTFNSPPHNQEKLLGLLVIVSVLVTLAYLLAGYSIKYFEISQKQIQAERIDPYTELYNIAQLKEDVYTHAQSVLVYLDLTSTLAMLTGLGHEGKSQLIKQLSDYLSSRNEGINRCYRPPFSTGIITFKALSESIHGELYEVSRDLETFQFYWQGTSVSLVNPVLHCARIYPTMDIEKVASVLCDQQAGYDETIHWVKLNSVHSDRVDKLNYIQQIFKNDQFELYCQPYKTLSPPANTPTSFEVLLRVINSDGSILAPADFFPLINQFGLETQLDRWVIDRTFLLLNAQVEDWNLIDYCSINLTAKTLGVPNLAEQIISKALQLMIPLEKICFEITESSALNNEQQAIETLTTLREAGCKIAIDDFGTGYASFEYLRRLPLDVLKIDGAFVKNLPYNETDRLIVSSICTVAREMKLQTVAEFVESEAHIQILSDLGINYAQGYGVAKPMPLIACLKSMAKKGIKTVA